MTNKMYETNTKKLLSLFNTTVRDKNESFYREVNSSAHLIQIGNSFVINFTLQSRFDNLKIASWGDTCVAGVAIVFFKVFSIKFANNLNNSFTQFIGKIYNFSGIQFSIVNNNKSTKIVERIDCSGLVYNFSLFT